MKKESLIQTLALGIIVLFVGAGVVSGFNVNQYDKSNTAMDNHPPGRPTIKGPINMRPGTYKWTFVAIDTDGDNISYQIDWGDSYNELTGWYASGEKIIVSHCFSSVGRVSLLARAIDIHNATGEWGGLDIVIPKSNQIINLPFLQFLEQIHYAFPILTYIINWR